MVLILVVAAATEDSLVFSLGVLVIGDDRGSLAELSGVIVTGSAGRCSGTSFAKKHSSL